MDHLLWISDYGAGGAAGSNPNPNPNHVDLLWTTYYGPLTMAQAALLAAQAEKDAAREAAAAQLLRLQARLEEADEP